MRVLPSTGSWYRLSRLVMRRPGPDRDRQRGVADRARNPVLGDQVHPGRRARPARHSASAQQVDDALNTRVPAQPDRAARGRRRAPGKRPAGQGARRPGSRRSPTSPRSRRPARRPEQLADRGGAVQRPAERRDPASRQRRPGDPHPVLRGVAGQTAVVRRPRAQPRRPPAARAHDRDLLDADHPVPDDRLGRAAGQGGADELPQPERDARDPRVDLPGRPPPRAAGIPQRGRARRDPADLPVRGRVRARDRLRSVPAVADQGGPRRRRVRTRRRSRSGSSAPDGS